MLQVLRPDVGGWVTLSPKYWAGEPSDTDGGRAPYSAVLTGDPSWSSKLAVVYRDNARGYALRQRRVNDESLSNNVPFSVEKSECLSRRGESFSARLRQCRSDTKGITLKDNC